MEALPPQACTHSSQLAHPSGHATGSPRWPEAKTFQPNWVEFQVQSKKAAWPIFLPGQAPPGETPGSIPKLTSDPTQVAHGHPERMCNYEPTVQSRKLRPRERKWLPPELQEPGHRVGLDPA